MPGGWEQYDVIAPSGKCVERAATLDFPAIPPRFGATRRPLWRKACSCVAGNRHNSAVREKATQVPLRPPRPAPQPSWNVLLWLTSLSERHGWRRRGGTSDPSLHQTKQERGRTCFSSLRGRASVSWTPLSRALGFPGSALYVDCTTYYEGRRGPEVPGPSPLPRCSRWMPIPTSPGRTRGFACGEGTLSPSPAAGISRSQTAQSWRD